VKSFGVRSKESGNKGYDSSRAWSSSQGFMAWVQYWDIGCRIEGSGLRVEGLGLVEDWKVQG